MPYNMPDSVSHMDLQREARREEAGEVRQGQIDTLADELVVTYMNDWHRVADLLADDSNILADIAQAVSVMEYDKIKGIIYRYMQEVCEAEAIEQLGDR